MTLEDLRLEFPELNIEKFKAKGNEDEEDACYRYYGYDYYLINKRTAILLDKSSRKISSFTTKDKYFITNRNIQVASTWGDVENAYPNLLFYTNHTNTNHFTHKIDPATIAYDPVLNTAFTFYQWQFSKEQWDGILKVSNPSDFDTDYDAHDINPSIHQSIRQSIKVTEISVWDPSKEPEYY